MLKHCVLNSIVCRKMIETMGYENWWENVSDVLGILEGREEILLRVCVVVGGGWKEIVCTYGVWIDVGLRRSELP